MKNDEKNEINPEQEEQVVMNSAAPNVSSMFGGMFEAPDAVLADPVVIPDYVNEVGGIEEAPFSVDENGERVGLNDKKIEEEVAKASYERDPQKAFDLVRGEGNYNLIEKGHYDRSENGTFKIRTGEKNQRYTLWINNTWVMNLTESAEFALRAALSVANGRDIHFDPKHELGLIQRNAPVTKGLDGDKNDTGINPAGAADNTDFVGDATERSTDFYFKVGKHSGKSLQEVYEEDPSYLVYIKETAVEDRSNKKSILANAKDSDIEKLNELVDKYIEENQLDVSNDALMNRMMESEKFTFGKHFGSTLAEVAEKDIGYLVWMNGTYKDEVVEPFEQTVRWAVNNHFKKLNENISEISVDEAEARLFDLGIVYGFNPGAVSFSKLPKTVGSKDLIQELRAVLKGGLTYNYGSKTFDTISNSEEEYGEALRVVVSKYNELVEVRNKDIDKLLEETKLDANEGGAVSAADAVSDDVKALIRKGLDFGIAEIVVEEQIEDIGKMLLAYENESPMFLLANEAGTGKTFVLGGFIKELKDKHEVTDIVYLTMNQNLIAQIKDNLKEYGVEHVKFHTYSELGAGDVEVNYGKTILLADESHNISNTTSKRGDRGQSLLSSVAFSALASATPFKNPVDAKYLDATGLFDRVEGFNGFGEIVQIFGGIEDNFGYTPTYKWGGDSHGAKQFREWLMVQGLMTQREMKIPAQQIDNTFVPVKISDEWKALYDDVAEAYDIALAGIEELDPANVSTKQHRENTLKRILEASKLDATIEEARNSASEGRFPVIFSESRSARHLGMWRESGDANGKLHTFGEVVERMAEWEHSKAMAKMAGMYSEVSPPPFARFIVNIAAAYDEKGINTVLPSPVAYIKEKLGSSNVAEYTGALTTAKSEQELDAWQKGIKRFMYASVGKGATGVSMHNVTGDHPTTQIVNNLPWTAALVEQVSGRTVRYGLKGIAELKWLLATDIPMEQRLGARVSNRLIDMGASVKGIDHATAGSIMDALEGDNNEQSISIINEEGKLRLSEITLEEYLANNGYEGQQASQIISAAQRVASDSIKPMFDYFKLLEEVRDAVGGMKSLQSKQVEGELNERGQAIVDGLNASEQALINPFSDDDAIPATIKNKYEKRVTDALGLIESQFKGVVERVSKERVIKLVAGEIELNDLLANAEGVDTVPTGTAVEAEVEGSDSPEITPEPEIEAAAPEVEPVPEPEITANPAEPTNPLPEAKTLMPAPEMPEPEQPKALVDIAVDLIERGVRLEEITSPFEALTSSQMNHLKSSGVHVSIVSYDLPATDDGHLLMNASRPLLGGEVETGELSVFGRHFAMTNISDDTTKFDYFDENVKLDANLPVKIENKDLMLLAMYGQVEGFEQVDGQGFERFSETVPFENFTSAIENYNKVLAAANEVIASKAEVAEVAEVESPDADDDFTLSGEPATPAATAKTDVFGNDNTGKIQDTGYVPGAAKERWLALREGFEKKLYAGSNPFTLESPSKVFPKPNYEKLAREEMSHEDVAYLAALRNTIIENKKPKYRSKVDTWLKDQYNLLDAARAIIAGEDYKALLEKEYPLSERVFEVKWGGPRDKTNNPGFKVELLAGLYKNLTPKQIGFASHDLELSSRFFETNDQVRNYPSIDTQGDFKYAVRYKKVWKSFTEHRNNPFFKKYYSDFSNMSQEHIADLSSMLDEFQGKKKVKKEADNRMRFFVGYQRRTPDEHHVYYKPTKNADAVKIEQVPSGLSTVERLEWLDKNYERLEAEVTKIKQTTFRMSDNTPREGGVDWRMGRDVTQEELRETFGLRVIQFGNSTLASQKEAQARINDTYDSLADLAQILDVPNKAMGLNGTLSIAFGARGKSRKDALALAHYEPYHIIINLTRKAGNNGASGAGSLAHEWFHALDNHFSKHDLEGEENLGRYADTFLTDAASSPTKFKEDSLLRKEVKDGFAAIYNSIHNNAYYDASEKLDALMGNQKLYWSSTVELAARAFESYVKKKLTDNGVMNDFLVNIDVQHDDLDSIVPSIRGLEEFGIEEAFDSVFEAIKSKESNEGILLYKEEEVDAPVEAMAAQQWYVDALDRGMFALENIEAPETLDGLLNNAGLDKELNGDVWFKYNTEGSAGTLILPERVQSSWSIKNAETGAPIEDTIINETENYVWIDTNRVGADMVELNQLVASHAYHSGKTFIDSPYAQDKQVKEERNIACLESALRLGTTQHLLPSLITEKESFKWGMSRNGDLQALLNVTGRAVDDINGEQEIDKQDFVEALYAYCAFHNPLDEMRNGEVKRYLSKQEQVQEWVKPVEQATGLKVNVVNNVHELPASIQKGVTTNVKGLYDWNTKQSWIIANRVVDKEDAVKLALHEGIGHKGLVSFLERNEAAGGAEVSAVLDNIIKEVGKDNVRFLLDDNGAGKNLDYENLSDCRIAALEYVAITAETASGHFNKVADSTQELVANVFSDVHWKSGDIAELLEASRIYTLMEKSLTEKKEKGELTEVEFKEKLESEFIKVAGGLGERAMSLLGNTTTLKYNYPPHLAEAIQQQSYKRLTVSEKAELLVGQCSEVDGSMKSSGVKDAISISKNSPELLMEVVERINDKDLTIKAKKALVTGLSGAINQMEGGDRNEWRTVAFITGIIFHSNEMDILKHDAFKGNGDSFIGVELSNRSESRFGLISEDTIEKGRVRITYFDHKGFSGHATRDTFDELFEEARGMGLSKEVSGRLQELSQEAPFVRGTAIASEVERVNSGTKTMDDFRESVKALYETFPQTEAEKRESLSRELNSSQFDKKASTSMSM